MLRFSNPALEGDFCQQESKRLARQDGTAYFAFTLIWLGAMVPLALTKNRFTSFWAMLLEGPLLGTVAVMTPYLLLLHSRTRQLYTRHRLLCVSGFRLAALMLPPINHTLSHLKPDSHFSPSPGSFIGTILLGCDIASPWGLALGVRVDLCWHLILQALLAVNVAGRLVPGFCAVPYMQGPVAVQRFCTAGSRLTSWAGLLLPSLDWNPPLEGASEPSAQQGQQQCYALLVTLHIVFGFWLSTVAVYVTERKRRCEFLASELSRQEALRGLTPQQAAQHLGMPYMELLTWCTFDASAVWLWCLALLPPLAAAVWLSVLMLTAKFRAEV